MTLLFCPVGEHLGASARLSDCRAAIGSGAGAGDFQKIRLVWHLRAVNQQREPAMFVLPILILAMVYLAY
jgi:hypothetical protein